MELKNDLEQRADGKFYWNPIFGEKYCLGYQLEYRDEHAPLKLGYGRYLGSIDGTRMLFRQYNDRIFVYGSDASLPAGWYGDVGDDEPVFPMMRACFIAELTHPVRKAGVLKILEKYNELERKAEEARRKTWAQPMKA